MSPMQFEERKQDLNIPTLREWQHEASEKISAVWNKEPNSKVLIAACPGSGKTLMACVAITEKLKDGLISLVLVVSPTVNIKSQWKDQFSRLGVKAFDEASNEAMRFRRDRNDRMAGDYSAICITYAQLAMDKDLFAELAKREKVGLIADEVHHADDAEAYGQALSLVAERAKFKLALSGTPFNSSGGALAMCPSEELINDEGRVVRKALPLYSYDYSKAIFDNACRYIEFIKVYGIGKSTYRSLANDATFQRIVDLSKQNKTDSISALLDPQGEFLQSMLVDGLNSLQNIKRHDSKAGMLIVAKDKNHGAAINKLIGRMCRGNPDWVTYSTLEIYNDTEKAHERISALDKDRTDIIITVRMISEGVDVKRLRVGVYATDYRTRMFFVQFVGRFVRWEQRLDGTQHGRIIIPAHIDLLIFAREIEKMVFESLVAGQGGEGGGGVRVNELIETSTEKTADGIIFRGKEFDERDLSELFFKKHPSLRGILSEAQAIQAAKDANLDGSVHREASAKEPNWWDKNKALVHQIVKYIKLNGDDDEKVFAKVNAKANRHAGIPKVDKLVSIEAMKRRHAFLQQWLASIAIGKEAPNDF